MVKDEISVVRDWYLEEMSQLPTSGMDPFQQKPVDIPREEV